jgi:hypothetical protein
MLEESAEVITAKEDLPRTLGSLLSGAGTP